MERGRRAHPGVRRAHQGASACPHRRADVLAHALADDGSAQHGGALVLVGRALAAARG